MINASSSLVHPVTSSERMQLLRQKPFLVWFTGLSGAGKSTLAQMTERVLVEMGYKTYLLDGDKIRAGLNKDLTFSPEDRAENLRRTGEVANLMLDAGLVVVAAFISPFQKERQMIKEMVGQENFLEVYLNCPLSVCEKRDVKGLYKKARAGSLTKFTGIDSPYEPPSNPGLVLNTATENTDMSLSKIISSIKNKFL